MCVYCRFSSGTNGVLKRFKNGEWVVVVDTSTLPTPASTQNVIYPPFVTQICSPQCLTLQSMPKDIQKRGGYGYESGVVVKYSIGGLQRNRRNIDARGVLKEYMGNQQWLVDWGTTQSRSSRFFQLPVPSTTDVVDSYDIIMIQDDDGNPVRDTL